MNGFEVLVTIVFVILLIVAICFIVSFYVCDGYNCKAFTVAENEAPRGTKEYALALLNELYNDGIWPLPYVASAIITPLILWLLCVPMTVRAFAIVFLVSWIFIYFAFSFLGHHYIRFISMYVSDYIQGACPGVPPTRQLPTYNEDENEDNNNDNNNEGPAIDPEPPLPDLLVDEAVRTIVTDPLVEEARTLGNDLSTPSVQSYSDISERFDICS
jgi:hypothetical protein